MSGKHAKNEAKSAPRDALSGKGPFRATSPDAALFAQRSLSSTDWKVLAGIMLVAVAVRLWGLDWPASVVFDEVHFGGFAKKYIIGRYFFDVHPPLAKMLFAVFAFIGGFSGDSDFEFTPIGKDYVRDHVPYITMRMLPALCGLATIALCYATLRASGCRTAAAAVATLALTVENTFVTESRYILLDAPLVFFIAVSVYAFKRFENCTPFRANWFRYLFLTGLALGATVSSKWVGLFTIGWVGVLTVYQLWWVWGDLNVSVPNFAKQFAYRALFLIGVPVALYLGMFGLHFYCVDNYGDGAELLPRWFQAGLKHNTLPNDVLADVAYGSIVSMRHADTQGGWLHSHVQTYPAGSEQQQVTLYSHPDDNNLWRIDYADKPENQTAGEFEYLKDGSIVRLWHIATQRRLHSHDHRAPVSTQDYIFEVSGYGFPDFEGDFNDNWRVLIVDKRSVSDGKGQVKALRTYFQLQHVNLGCLLYSKNVRLPDWGFEQQEVSCIRGGKTHNTVWVVESNMHPDFPADAERLNYPVPSFFQKFVALNKAMWDVNKGLTEPHNWESRPSSWVLLKRGINMWGETNRQVYLIGNLPIYWVILGSIVVIVVVKAIRILAWQHIPGFQFAPSENTALALFDAQFGRYALGWWFHLFPSFFMARQLFLHHYLGSLYFGVLMIGQLIELLLSYQQRRARAARVAIGVFFASVLVWFYLYAPLAYGSPWTKQQCVARKFFDMDFDCNLFFDDINQYKAQAIELKESRYSAFHNLTTLEPTTTASEEAEEHPPTAPVEYEINEHVVLQADEPPAAAEPQQQQPDIADESEEAAQPPEEPRAVEEEPQTVADSNAEVSPEESTEAHVESAATIEEPVEPFAEKVEETRIVIEERVVENPDTHEKRVEKIVQHIV